MASSSSTTDLLLSTMASSSSTTSSLHKSFKYDVYLSFRGEDIRKTFIDHLYSALKQQGICTYKDDQTLRKKETMDDGLLKAIEESKFFIIVFSKNYASSSWCLNELVKIIERHNTTDQIAYPVFYDVDPSDVRKQSGAFGEAFAKHNNKKETGKWREALLKAGNLTGWDLKNGHEAKFMEKIVEEISLELHSTNLWADANLVGMERRVKKVISLLETSIDDVRMIGIWGIGGSGKTTLARAVFDLISTQFEGKSFVENVREVSSVSVNGLMSLQKKILSDMLHESITIRSVFHGEIRIKERLCNKKVLIVLEDVDHIDQLQALAGEPNWFSPGSRIIITTRDKHLLLVHKVKYIHQVSLLSHEESVNLFSRHAFGREIPIQGYKELALEAVGYIGGLPLTIKVLGSFLYGKKELQWIDALKRLKVIPLEEILKKLELSYNDLEVDSKEIFLIVACLLKGLSIDRVFKILESLEFHTRDTLRILAKRSLITIDDYQYIAMHDLIQEMGRNIVRHLHPYDPERHSHLWILTEIEEILANDLGTEATRAIAVDSPVKLCSEVVTKGFGSMKNLRLLHVVSEIDDDCDEKIGQTSPNFPNALRFLSWVGYPYWCLPKTFEANNLVALEMPYSRITQLWEGGESKILYKLKFLNLRHSRLRTLDLGLTPNVGRLDLQGCNDLVELWEGGERKILYKLKFLNLRHSQLRTLDLRLTPNLESLDLEDCNHLVQLHMPRIGYLESLVYANLSGCSRIKKLIPNKGTLEELELRYIRLPWICKAIFLDVACLLKGLLKDDVIRILAMYGYEVAKYALRVLVEASIVSIDDHQYVVMHPHIEAMGKNIVLRGHPDKPNQHLHSRLWIREEIEYVLANDLGTEATEAIVVDTPVTELSSEIVTKGFGSMKNLKLLGVVSEIDDDCDEKIGQISLNFPNALRFLSWVGYPLGSLPKTFEAYNLVALEMPYSRITQLWEEGGRKTLFSLKFLNLRHTQVRTLDLGMTPSLERLELEGCNHLVELLHSPITCLSRLVYLNLSGCSGIRSFVFIKELGSLKILSLSRLYMKEFPDIIPGHYNSSLLELKFRYNDIEEVPSSISNLWKLVRLDFHSCKKLRSLPDSICDLQHLRNLKLYGCSLEELPEDIARLGFLEKLNLSYARIKHLPTSICNLKRLKTLNLSFCRNLEKLPGDIGRLACLKKLILKKCTQVRDIPDSICQLKSLEYLSLLDCVELEKLPKKLGNLVSLKMLNVKGTQIRQLPLSISKLIHLEIHAPRKDQSCFD